MFDPVITLVRFLAAWLMLFFIIASHANVTRGADPITDLKFWLWDSQGVLLELKQRLPDQTRGFFEARGFDAESREIAATACMFQTMFRNNGEADSGEVEINLQEWRVISNGKSRPMLLREDWDQTWTAVDAPLRARIAFEWALLPTSQVYDPGDYNWGMSSYGLLPGSVFDLEFSWLRDGKQHHGRIEMIECPHDIHPDPPAAL